MKRIIVLAAVCAWASTAGAQITKTTVGSGVAKANVVNARYDSMSNFLGTSPQLYEGQALYLKENKKAEAAGGYIGFGKKPDFDFGPYGFNCYAGVAGADGRKISEYNKLKGQYFTVVSAIVHPHPAYSRNAFSHYLRLVNADNETLYYAYDAHDKNAFNNMFVVVGYFEKMKEILKDKAFIYTGKEPSGSRDVHYTGLRDMKTGEKRTDVKAGSVWECADVSIEDGNNYEVIAILSNSDYGTVYVPVEDVQNTAGANAKFTTSKAVAAKSAADQQAVEQKKQDYEARLAECIAKFGEENGRLVADGKVKVGMTKEMCTMAMGTPLNIVHFTEQGKDIEQWFYTSGYYYYFRGNVIYKEGFRPPYQSDFKALQL